MGIDKPDVRSLFMRMFRIALKIITRKRAVQEEMEKNHMLFYCMMIRILQN